MHDNSLPTGDRADTIGDLPRMDEALQWPRLVIRLADGSYFRTFRRRGGFVAVKTLKFVKLFHLTATEAIGRTIAKLRRRGAQAEAFEVRIRIAQPPRSTAS